MRVLLFNVFTVYSIKFKYIGENILNKLSILFKNPVGHNVLFALPG